MRPKTLSSDSHVMEPPDLWSAAVPPRFADLAPHVEMDQDADWWVQEGRRLFSFSVATKAGLRFEGQDRLSVDYRFSDVRPGSYLPEAHVADNETDGVSGSVLYPSVATILFGLEDTEALSVLGRIYNDWIAEFCQAAPDRLKGIGIVNVDDITDAVRELERMRGCGLAGAMIPVAPLPELPYDSPEYEALWTAAERLELPLSLHIASNRSPDDWRQLWTQAGFVGSDHYVRDSIGRMIFSGVFERHPGLMVGSVEHEAAWAPYFLERMDYTYTERTPRPGWYRFTDDARPSDFFHTNVFISFQEDRVGVQLRDVIGVDNLLWGSDYPHAESTFPRSQAILDDIMSGVPSDERAQMTSANTARLYGFAL